MTGVVLLHQVVEYSNIAMIGETEVANYTLLTLFHQIVKHTVINETSVEVFYATSTYCV